MTEIIAFGAGFLVGGAVMFMFLGAIFAGLFR